MVVTHGEIIRTKTCNGAGPLAIIYPR